VGAWLKLEKKEKKMQKNKKKYYTFLLHFMLDFANYV